MRNSIKKCYTNVTNAINSVAIHADGTYICMLILIVIGYVLIHDLIGDTLLDHNLWDSYTLQAKAWLDGHTYLDQNYSYLEIATYKNHFYVSFPPVPSVLMLPFVLIYGVNTPNNIIMIIYILIAVTLVYQIARFMKMREILAAFWSIVIVFGCNMTWMSTMGGVWFQAQLVNMIFLLAAILAMLYNRRVLSYIFIALAVGCRPFSIVYFFVLMVYFYNKDCKKDFIKVSDKKKNNSNIEAIKRLYNALLMVLKQWKGIVCAGIIGICYMIYNYVRFDNPLEFGHNYLPEFLESESGQFNIEYVATNLYRIFLNGIKITNKMGLKIPRFDGFIVFIANPIFIIYLVYIIKNIIKSKKNQESSMVSRAIVLMTICNMLLLCFHKTMGGWQFGNRYLVDLIPFILLYILFTKQKENKINKIPHWERLVGIFAVMFNVYGVMMMYITDLKA